MELLDDEDREFLLAAVPAKALRPTPKKPAARGGFFASATLRAESTSKLASVAAPAAALGTRRRAPQTPLGPSPAKAVPGSARASDHTALLGVLNKRFAANTR